MFASCYCLDPDSIKFGFCKSSIIFILLQCSGCEQFLAVKHTQTGLYVPISFQEFFSMHRREHRDQLLFKDFFLSFGGQLSGDNGWIKLAELTPRDELDNDDAAQFCKAVLLQTSHFAWRWSFDHQRPLRPLE